MLLKHALLCSALTMTLIAGTANANTLNIPEGAANKIVGVNISDVVNNYSNIVPGFANVVLGIKKTPEVFFRNGSIVAVHQVFLNKLPEATPGQVSLSLTAYVKYREGSKFEKIIVAYNNGAKKIEEMSISQVESNDLTDMNFNLTVGLVDRKLIINDEAKNVKFIVPIGVGGFDEGVMNEGKVSLITPRFKHGFIDKRTVISKRDKPRYFDNKPFIRILKGTDLKEDMTAIGFHTEINDEFVRGFDSHGCMRLRVPDLMALHDLIMDGDVQQTPIQVLYRPSDSIDHPAGKRNKVYKTVTNVGTKQSPFFPLDQDNLVQLGYKEKAGGAPLDQLVDEEADNYEDLFDYDTQSQLRDQNARRKTECQAKLMAGQIGTKQSDMDSCLNAGKREKSIKDFFYKKYMRIN